MRIFMKKIAMVTGASGGIGQIFVRELVKETLDEIWVIGRNQERLLMLKEEFGDKIVPICKDLTKDTDIVSISDLLREQSISVLWLVNNAGIAHIGLLMDMSDDEWNRILQTNLSSVFYCCREAVPAMVREKAGRIINVSSMWGISGASCEAAYSATKAGINGLTRALAKELAPSNIQVNAVAFGVIDTDMNRQLDEEERKLLEEEIPAGRFGTPQEAAEIIWGIANAPAYMTGQVIGFDGGF